MNRQPNERITEQIVRNHLSAHASAVGAHVWEQVIDNNRIGGLLQKASKSGKGPGRPEFVVGFDAQNDFLLTIECKADIAKHESKNRDQPAIYAVDGVLHYAKFLSREFNVLGIAVSGMEPTTLRVDHFWHLKGESKPQHADFAELMPLSHYLSGYAEHGIPRQHGLHSLEKLARDLNSQLHGLKVTPADRSLLVSAILVSLTDKSFRDSYPSMSGSRLLKRLKETLLHQMENAGVEEFGLKGIQGRYGFLNVAGVAELSKGRHLADMIADIDTRGMPLIRRLGPHDTIGKFYLEFLRYSNNDKELGIVLTPQHITELAVALAGVGKEDVVYDSCAGTGGFLVAAMKAMLSGAEGDERKKKTIRKKQIVGVEVQASIVSLLYSNMFIHGDGRSNILQGDCFSDEVIQWVRTGHSPTVGLLNPPFKDKPSDTAEMEFVLNNLSALRKDGNSRCVALLPMPWTRRTRGKQLALKRQLMRQHTLEAVISLPNSLFYNSHASVVTCLLVIKAHRPHPPNKKTWFAYGKDDGFEMRQHFGRVDHNGRWEFVKKEWLDRYINRENVPLFSVMRNVGPEDEWCAEAYLEADYASLTQGDYQRVLRDFVLAKKRASWAVDSPKPSVPKKHSLVPLSDVFAIERGHGLSYNQQTEDANGINFVARGSVNNGVRGSIAPVPGEDPKPAGMLTVAASGSVLETFLQTAPFYTGVGTLCLTPKRQMSDKVKLYYCMLIRANKFRYNYGREANATLGEILVPALEFVPEWVHKVDCDHVRE